MHVALLAHTPCALCGYRVELLMCGTARVNKRSLRVRGPFLGAFRFTRCPECGWDVAGESMRPRTAYVLCPRDAAKVAEYRARRWGVESPVGVLVEVGAA